MASVYSYPKKIIVYSDYNKERRIAGGENALTLLGTDLEGQFSFIAYKDGAVKVYIFLLLFSQLSFKILYNI